MKHKKLYKTVLLPIQVSEGEYCWGFGKICGHFDNEGGHPTCKFDFDVDCDKDGSKEQLMGGDQVYDGHEYIKADTKRGEALWYELITKQNESCEEEDEE